MNLVRRHWFQPISMRRWVSLVPAASCICAIIKWAPWHLSSTTWGELAFVAFFHAFAVIRGGGGGGGSCAGVGNGGSPVAHVCKSRCEEKGEKDYAWMNLADGYELFWRQETFFSWHIVSSSHDCLFTLTHFQMGCIHKCNACEHWEICVDFFVCLKGSR